MVSSYALVCAGILGLTTIDALVRIVMEACGLVPLDVYYVLQVGPTNYATFVLFVRSFSLWVALQACHYVYRLIYPSPQHPCGCVPPPPPNGATVSTDGVKVFQ